MSGTMRPARSRAELRDGALSADGTQVVYGIRRDAYPERDTVKAGNNAQQAVVAASAVSAIPPPQRIVKIGAWLNQLGRDAARAYLAVWRVGRDAGGREYPQAVVAQTARFDVPNQGRIVIADCTASYIPAAGERLAYGIVVTRGEVNVGCIAGAAGIWKRDSGDGSVKTFDSTATTTLTDRPFGIFALAANQATPPPPGPTGPNPGPTGPTAPTGGSTGPTLPGIPDPPVRPNAPVLTAPQNGAAFSGKRRPVLEWLFTDVKDRKVDCEVQLTQPDQTIRYVRVPKPSGGAWRLDLNAASPPVSQFGWHQWDVRAWAEDGGRVVDSTWSHSRAFTYDDRVNVRILAPASGANVAEVRPVLRWDLRTDADNLPVARGQQRYRIQLFAARTGALVHDTGQRPGGAGEWLAPAGVLENGGIYRARLSAWLDEGKALDPVETTFTMRFDAPRALAGMTVAARRLPGDLEPSTPLVTWSPTTLGAAFDGYLVRRAVGGAAVSVWYERNAGVTSFWDTAAPGNAAIAYSVQQVARGAGGALVPSAAVTRTVQVDLRIPVLCSMRDGIALRAPAFWLADGLSGSFEREQEDYVTWGSRGRPVVVQTPVSYGRRSLKVRLTLRGDDEATLRQRFAMVEALALSGHPLVWRGEWERLFCRVESFAWTRAAVGAREADVTLSEIDFEEGVEI